MSIRFVPGEGWVSDSGVNVSAGSSDLAWLQEQRAKKDGARRSMYGSYDQYMGQDNLDWLKQNVGDSWWWSTGRLGNLANDESRFWKEFGGTSDQHYGNSAEIVNRYKALVASGMDPADVQSAIWGGANLSPTFQNSGAGVGVTKPGMLGAQNMSQAAQMLANGAGQVSTQGANSAAQMLSQMSNRPKQPISSRMKSPNARQGMVNDGLFSGLSQGDVYADLLKRLGLGA